MNPVPIDLALRPLAVTARAASWIAAGGRSVLASMHRTGAEVAIEGIADVLWLSPPGLGLLPLHVVVGRTTLDALRALAARTGRPRIAFDLTAVRRLAWTLHANPALADLRGMEASLRPVRGWLAGQVTGLGVRAEDLFEPACRWSAAFDPDASDGDALAALRALIGRGNGSTPAGDDVLIGALALAFAIGRHDVRYMRQLRALVPSLHALTTSASATYLRAALDASFGSHLHVFARSVGQVSSGRIVALAQRVAGHGATSGVDTLAGFVAAATALTWPPRGARPVGAAVRSGSAVVSR